jgi:uncharacterized protein (TIGR03067 family)
MRRIVVLPILAMLSSALAAESAELAGGWTAREAVRDGAAAGELVGHRLEFAGNRFEIMAKDGTLLYAGTYTLDATVLPARIDFRHDGGEAVGQTWEGIYRLDGGALTIVDDAPDPAKGRPADFAAPAGSGYVMLVFVR